MTPEKTIEALNKCREYIRPLQPFSERPRLEHAFKMCDKASVFVAEGKLEKAFRWLGFIQGVMWCETMITIDLLKAMNKDD